MTGMTEMAMGTATSMSMDMASSTAAMTGMAAVAATSAASMGGMGDMGGMDMGMGACKISVSQGHKYSPSARRGSILILIDGYRCCGTGILLMPVRCLSVF